MLVNELQRFLTSPVKMYKIGKAIADGAFGRVCRARPVGDNDELGEQVAIKSFFILRKKHSIQGVVYLREVDIMQRCRHENILRAIKVCYDWPFNEPRKKGSCIHPFDKVFTVMPLAINSAYYYVRQNTIVVTHLKRIMLQISLAVEYMHANGIAHRDLKSTNILFFSSEKHAGLLDAKLCDFGMSKPLTKGHPNSTYVGTAIYKPPELLLSTESHVSYDYSADIWSLGVLFFELINATYPFDGENDLEVLTRVFRSRGSCTPEVWEKLVFDNPDCLISYDKIKKLPHKRIDILYKRNYHAIDTFDSGIESGTGAVAKDPVPNFGTLHSFTELLERILCLDPDSRPTIREVVESDFFSALPDEEHVASEIDKRFATFDLIKTKPCVPKKIILRKIGNEELRKAGLDIILHLNSKFHDNVWRIIFLAIDIYDRAVGVAVHDQTVTVDEDANIYIAGSCCYIAVKYFLDESTPSLEELFPRIKFNIEKLIGWEKKILTQYLDWCIYRPTVYDLLEKKVRPDVLLKTFRNHPQIYGSDVRVVAKIFEDEIAEASDISE